MVKPYHPRENKEKQAKKKSCSGMEMVDVEKPRANQKYRLSVDGKLLNGTTDGDGVLDEYIATGSRAGKLIIGPDNFTLEIDFGFLDPISELSGVQKRLNNVGFDCGE